jgi:glycosyltransferase involved in cell wall biosynthesis
LIATGLHSCGHDVRLFIPQRFEPGPLEEDYEGIKVVWGTEAHGKNWNSLPELLRARVSLFKKVTRAAKEGMHWVICSNIGSEGVPLLISLRRQGVRVAAEYCDMRLRPKRMTGKAGLRYAWQSCADAVVPRFSQLNVPISTYLDRWLKNKAPETPTIILPPLVDSDRFQSLPERARSFRDQWQIPPEKTLVSYLGSFWDLEGIAVLLKAAQQLMTEGWDFYLAISGDAVPGRANDDVSAMVQGFKMGQRTRLTGWLKTEEVLAALSAADITVVPKLNHVANQAGVPTKIAEYLSAAKPVLTSRIGDIPHYLKDGESAYFAEPGSVESLKAALKSALSDGPKRERIGLAGREVAEKIFDYRAATRRLSEHFTSVPVC